MNVTPLEIEGIKLVENKLFSDHRGFFTERFNVAAYRKAGLPTEFLQDNHSRSTPGVLRGLHFQAGQGKLVGVVRGTIWDVAVDIRPGSATLGKWFGVELSAENGRMLWIPNGFAHGFCVLGAEPADVLYKVDALYDAKAESGIAWDDPDLKVAWPIRDPIVSSRDQQLTSFNEYRQISARI